MPIMDQEGELLKTDQYGKQAREIGDHVNTRYRGAMDSSPLEDENFDEIGEKLKQEALKDIGHHRLVLADRLQVPTSSFMLDQSQCRAIRHGETHPMQNPKHMAMITHNMNSITCVACHENIVVFGDKHGYVYLTNVTKGTKTRLEPRCVSSDKKGAKAHVLCVAISDASAMATANTGMERSTIDTSVTSLIAASGTDPVIRLWSLDGTPFGELRGHREAVTGLSFRLGTNMLYSCGYDMCLRVWSGADGHSIDRLYGHRSRMLSIHGLHKERCITGGMDHCLKYWKVDGATQMDLTGSATTYVESVAMVDEQTVLAATSDGSISLHDVGRKHALHTIQFTHGACTRGDGTGLERECLEEANVTDTTRDDAQSAFSGNAVTLTAIPFSDLAFSGGCDGTVKFWKLGGGHLPKQGTQRGASARNLALLGEVPVHGIVNGLAVKPDGSMLYVAVAKEPRLGRWVTMSSSALNCVLCIPLSYNDVDAAIPTLAAAPEVSVPRLAPITKIAPVKRENFAAAKPGKNRPGTQAKTLSAKKKKPPQVATDGAKAGKGKSTRDDGSSDAVKAKKSKKKARVEI